MYFYQPSRMYVFVFLFISLCIPAPTQALLPRPYVGDTISFGRYVPTRTFPDNATVLVVTATKRQYVAASAVGTAAFANTTDVSLGPITVSLTDKFGILVPLRHNSRTSVRVFLDPSERWMNLRRDLDPLNATAKALIARRSAARMLLAASSFSRPFGTASSVVFRDLRLRNPRAGRYRLVFEAVGVTGNVSTARPLRQHLVVSVYPSKYASILRPVVLPTTFHPFGPLSPQPLFAAMDLSGSRSLSQRGPAVAFVRALTYTNGTVFRAVPDAVAALPNGSFVLNGTRITVAPQTQVVLLGNVSATLAAGLLRFHRLQLTVSKSLLTQLRTVLIGCCFQNAPNTTSTACYAFNVSLSRSCVDFSASLNNSDVAASFVTNRSVPSRRLLLSQPAAVLAGTVIFNVTISSAGVFGARVAPHLLCRYGPPRAALAGHPLLGNSSLFTGTATVVDECQLRCTFNTSLWGSPNSYLPAYNPYFMYNNTLYLTRKEGNATKWLPAGPLTILADRGSYLTADFSSRTMQIFRIIPLDPFGNTLVPSIEVTLLDQRGVAIRDVVNITRLPVPAAVAASLGVGNLTSTGDVLVSSTSPHVVLGGTTIAPMINGTAPLPLVRILGYPPIRNYTFLFRMLQAKATNISSIADVNVITGQIRFFVGFQEINLCDPNPVVDGVTRRIESTRTCDTTRTASGLPAVADCSTTENVSLVVTGRYFGLSGASILLGNETCLIAHDAAAPATRINATCRAPSGNSSVSVVSSRGRWGRSPAPLVAAYTPIVVLSVSGCNQTIFDMSGKCSSTAATNITILGTNLGNNTNDTVVTINTTRASLRCTNLTIIVPHTRISCMIPASFGYGYRVVVYDARRRENSASNVFVSYRQRFGAHCPIDNDGFYCSNRGSCDISTGVCTCQSTAALGYWRGAQCNLCQSLFFGDRCTGRCPSCAPQSSACSDGRTGTGTCVCNYGYYGTLCNFECPGSALTPCTNHGFCFATNGTCRCSTNGTLGGSWTGASCAQCDPFWSGSGCDVPCPVSQSLPCSGHGTCLNGKCACATNYCDVACNVSFAACGGCPVGTYGLSCQHSCPGGNGSNTCTGHGACSDGPYGSGLCTCTTGYGGASCAVPCPPNPSNPCSGHGTCAQETGQCTCTSGYALADCSIQCPGGFVTPCNNHGRCSIANGTCECSQGYSGLACDKICPGGVTSPCSFHGTCSQTTSLCQCHADPVRGYWAGTTCSQCATDWWGASCNQQCNFVNGYQCAGHGQCTMAVTCNCFKTTQIGFWTGQNCTECVPGYWGTSCSDECPGSACNSCNQHGICSDGVLGNGTCACDAAAALGYWTGSYCEGCQSGHFGVNCTGKCPRGVGGLICSGRGSCSEGIFGTGECACTSSWGGLSCSECAYGFFGIGCSKQCPGPVGNPCFGRGFCNSSEYASGHCRCNYGYGGTDCSLECPRGPYGICNNKGECVSQANALVCTNCAQSLATGYWQGYACDECLSGFFGSQCRSECPGGSSNPCNGQGVCLDGYTGDGRCKCRYGYAGLSCDTECVGGVLNPCSGHGTCDTITGACTCFNSATGGYWRGSNCSSCDAPFRGATCTVACPNTTAGICNAAGVCYEGTCISCSSGLCGQFCNQSVACVSCPAGTYGPSCTPCPGGAAIPCSGHGVCLSGMAGSGLCLCYPGYKSSECSIRCPGPEGVPCYGRGLCTVAGTCICTTGWAGSACETACNGYDPVRVTSPCSARGECSTVDGSCTCVYGFGGSSCQQACPAIPSSAAPCNGNGLCSQSALCNCFLSDSTGFWNGSACHHCATGYFGANCKRKCVNGISDATFTGCTCDTYWSGAACDTACPGLLEGGPICSGHGNCSWGSTQASTCTCEADWYNASCAHRCMRADCHDLLLHGQCNKDTGFCECQFDADGHWTFSPGSPFCDTCDPLYYGELCELECKCNGNGVCNRRTGSCQCYEDVIHGYWGGKFCDACLDGYVGVDCKTQNVKISRLGVYGTSVVVANLAIRKGLLCYDDQFGWAIVGTNPITVISELTSRTILSLDVGGFALQCYMKSAREVYIYVYREDRSALVIIDRQTGGYLRTEFVQRLSEVVTARRRFEASSLPAVPSAEAARAVEWMSVYDRLVDTSFQEGSAETDVFSRRSFSAEAVSTNATDALLNGFLRPLVGPRSDLVVTVYPFGEITMQLLSAGLVSSARVDGSCGRVKDVSSAVHDASLMTILCIGGGTPWEILLASASFPSIPAMPVQVVTSMYGPYAARIHAGCFNRSCYPVLAMADANSVVAVFVSDVGTFLARMQHTAAGNASFCMQLIFDHVAVATTMSLDTYANIGFLATHTTATPSLITKFDIDSCVVTGTITLGVVGADREIAVAMVARHSLRTLEILAPLSNNQRVVKLSMFAVKLLDPTIADTRGGTPITVTGEGFIGGSVMRCSFRGRDVPATFINKHTVICSATEGGTESCSGEVVEAVVVGAGTTSNGHGLKRVSSASIRAVVNNETGKNVGYTHGSYLSVTGAGFSSCVTCGSDVLKCKLFSPTSASSVLVVNAQFVSSAEVRCELPAVVAPFPIPSYLEVTLDGYVFSQSSITYDILGDPNHLVALSPPALFTVKSSSATRLPDIIIGVADSAGHALRDLFVEKNTHTMNISIAGALDGILIGSRNSSEAEGVANFSGLVLIFPTVGIADIIVLDEQRLWRATLSFRVTEGEPHRMYFVRFPSEQSANVAPTLQVQPIVGLLDEAGNPIASVKDKATVVPYIEVYYSYHDLQDRLQNRSFTVALTDSDFKVEGVLITGKHGYKYYVNFTSHLLPIRSLLSPPITISYCEQDEYSIPNSTKCLPCPDHAICDGTSSIQAQENWWRADDTTLVFYSCAAPFGGNSCLNNSRCLPGYTGPRCSTCVAGYGRSYNKCVKCRDDLSNVVLLAMMIAVFLVVLCTLIFLVIISTSTDYLPVIFRNYVTHVQILSRLRDVQLPWSETLQGLWETVARFSTLEAVDVSPIDCALHLDYYEKFGVIIASPVLLIVLCFPIAYFFVRRYRKHSRHVSDAVRVAFNCRSMEAHDVVARLRQREQHAIILRKHRFQQLRNEEHGPQVDSSTSDSENDFDPTELPSGANAWRVRVDAQGVYFDPSTIQEPEQVDSNERKTIISIKSEIDERKDFDNETTSVVEVFEEDETFGEGEGSSETPPSSQSLQDLVDTAEDPTAYLDRIHELLSDADGMALGPTEIAGNPLLPSRRNGVRRSSFERARRTQSTMLLSRISHILSILHIRGARYRIAGVILVSSVTILSLLYPTLIQSCGQVLRCEVLDFGAKQGLVEVSINQRTTRCDSAKHTTFSTVSITMLVGYGFLIPALIIASGTILDRFFGGFVIARVTLNFVMAGLKTSLWFWEAVNMTRKFLVMVVVVFVLEAKLQTISFFWVVALGFVLHIVLAPYQSQVVHHLEAVGQSTTVLTLNIILFSFFLETTDIDTDWRWSMLTALIIFINAVVIAAYVAAMIYFGGIRLTYWWETRAHATVRDTLLEDFVVHLRAFAQDVDVQRQKKIDLIHQLRNLDKNIEGLEEQALFCAGELYTGMEQARPVAGDFPAEPLMTWKFPEDDRHVGFAEKGDVRVVHQDAVVSYAEARRQRRELGEASFAEPLFSPREAVHDDFDVWISPDMLVMPTLPQSGAEVTPFAQLPSTADFLRVQEETRQIMRQQFGSSSSDEGGPTVVQPTRRRKSGVLTAKTLRRHLEASENPHGGYFFAEGDGGDMFHMGTSGDVKLSANMFTFSSSEETSAPSALPSEQAMAPPSQSELEGLYESPRPDAVVDRLTNVHDWLGDVVTTEADEPQAADTLQLEYMPDERDDRMFQDEEADPTRFDALGTDFVRPSTTADPVRELADVGGGFHNDTVAPQGNVRSRLGFTRSRRVSGRSALVEFAPAPITAASLLDDNAVDNPPETVKAGPVGELADLSGDFLRDVVAPPNATHSNPVFIPSAPDEFAPAPITRGAASFLDQYEASEDPTHFDALGTDFVRPSTTVTLESELADVGGDRHVVAHSDNAQLRFGFTRSRKVPRRTASDVLATVPTAGSASLLDRDALSEDPMRLLGTDARPSTTAPVSGLADLNGDFLREVVAPPNDAHYSVGFDEFAPAPITRGAASFLDQNEASEDPTHFDALGTDFVRPSTTADPVREATGSDGDPQGHAGFTRLRKVSRQKSSQDVAPAPTTSVAASQQDTEDPTDFDASQSDNVRLSTAVAEHETELADLNGDFLREVVAPPNDAHYSVGFDEFAPAPITRGAASFLDQHEASEDPTHFDNTIARKGKGHPRLGFTRSRQASSRSALNEFTPSPIAAASLVDRDDAIDDPTHFDALRFDFVRPSAKVDPEGELADLNGDFVRDVVAPSSNVRSSIELDPTALDEFAPAPISGGTASPPLHAPREDPTDFDGPGESSTRPSSTVPSEGGGGGVPSSHGDDRDELSRWFEPPSFAAAFDDDEHVPAPESNRTKTRGAFGFRRK